jgi:hypothetical protein
MVHSMVHLPEYQKTPNPLDKIADDDPVQRLVCLPVNTAGLALPDPMVKANSPSRKRSNTLSLDPSDERSGSFQSGRPTDHHPTGEDKIERAKNKGTK